MISDTILSQLIISGAGVLTTIVTVIGVVARSNHRQRERIESHVDRAVEKGVENVKKEMRRRASGAFPAVTDAVVNIPAVIADRPEVIRP